MDRGLPPRCLAPSLKMPTGHFLNARPSLSPPKASDQTLRSRGGIFVLRKFRTRLAGVRDLSKTKNARRASDLMPLKLSRRDRKRSEQSPSAMPGRRYAALCTRNNLKGRLIRWTGGCLPARDHRRAALRWRGGNPDGPVVTIYFPGRGG